MTVKELIKHLMEIENKFYEVEMMSPSYSPYPIERVINAKQNKKVILISPSNKP